MKSSAIIVIVILSIVFATVLSGVNWLLLNDSGICAMASDQINELTYSDLVRINVRLVLGFC